MKRVVLYGWYRMAPSFPLIYVLWLTNIIFNEAWRIRYAMNATFVFHGKDENDWRILKALALIFKLTLAMYFGGVTAINTQMWLFSPWKQLFIIKLFMSWKPQGRTIWWFRSESLTTSMLPYTHVFTCIACFVIKENTTNYTILILLSYMYLLKLFRILWLPLAMNRISLFETDFYLFIILCQN